MEGRTMSLKGSRTEENLKAAFAGESQANRRYLYFAQKADVEGLNDVSAVFRSTAEGETGHAHGHLEFLEEVGDPVTGTPIGATDDNLRAAIAGETHEYTDMYPGMARTAREEGFDDIADWFETLAKTEAEMRRIFEICHGCRRCFNLCDAFPRLFDLIDNSATGEVDGVAVADYHNVADACTLCDMCFMTKCPYVPPHEFNLDFPHTMLRYRAVELKEGSVKLGRSELAKTDRNGELASLVAPLANWSSDRHNRLTRPLLETVAQIDRDAALPRYHGSTFVRRARRAAPPVDTTAPAAGRKAVLYATCFVNYNNPGIGEAAQAVLAKNGVATEVVYPQCCGMPQFEAGDLAKVAAAAKSVSTTLGPWIERATTSSRSCRPAR